MLSTCPACLDMVNHEDHLSQVTCACGHQFSPFLAAEDNHSADAFSVNEPGSSELVGSLDSFSTAAPTATEGQSFSENLLNENFGNVDSTAKSFEESTAAFAELREFGEALIPGAPEPSIMPSPPPSPAQTTENASHGVHFSAPANTDNCLMTAGDVLQGYQVTHYLSPLSVVSDLNLGGGDPLKGAYDAIWTQAKNCGANAVVAMKWTITPDGRKVILSGTPVRCVKVA